MRSLAVPFAFLCALAAGPARAQPVTPPVLSLAEAISRARAYAPSAREASATTQAFEARKDGAEAPLLPQLVGSASYQRMTGNFVFRPGVNAATLAGQAGNPTTNTYNFFNFGLSASQLLYDFGTSTGLARSAHRLAQAQQERERGVLIGVDLSVREAFFRARAQKQLLAVAHENLANQSRHAEQIQAYVEVGTRPEIDLAQVRMELSSARVRVIQSESDYLVARHILASLIGMRSEPIEVADDELAALAEEDGPLSEVVAELKLTPSLQALRFEQGAFESRRRALRGRFAPSLSLVASLSDAGTHIDELTWNYGAGLFLSWNLIDGGATSAAVREARAEWTRLVAREEDLDRAARLAVERARLRIRAARDAATELDELVHNARRRRELAEGRYETGLGNVIELEDAQLALSNAQARRVQADYDLFLARAELLYALGKSQ